MACFSFAGRLPILPVILIMGLAACGTPHRAPVVQYGLHEGATSAGVHTVSGGDTLWNIAERYRIDMKDMIYVNNLRAPYDLIPGDRLVLPPPSTYTVKPGDTLYDISRTFDVSMTQLVRLNDLEKPYTVYRGQDLRLPSVMSAQTRAKPEVQMALAQPQVIPNGQAAPIGPAVMAQPVEPVRKSLPVPTSTPAMSGGGNGKFAWPVDGPVISTYGPKKDGLHNDGVNIRVARGQPVRAAENGVVVYADNQLEGFGNLVLIRHEDRWMTAYAHLDQALVRKGQQVRRGETIGAAGSSGGVDTPQLHFEIRRGTEALNPELYLARQGS